MKAFECIITDKAGVHARPAGALATLCKQFSSEILIQKEESGEYANATKLIAVMALGIKQGDRVKVSANGFDEEKAIEAVKKFIAENF